MPVSPSVIPEISVSSQLEVMYFYLLSEWKFGRVWSRSPRWMGSNSNFRMVKPTWWQRGRSCLPLINMLDERTKTSCKIKLDKNKNIRLDRQRNFLNFPLKIWWLSLWQHFIYIFKIPILKTYAMFFFYFCFTAYFGRINQIRHALWVQRKYINKCWKLKKTTHHLHD